MAEGRVCRRCGRVFLAEGKEKYCSGTCGKGKVGAGMKEKRLLGTGKFAYGKNR